MRVTVLRAPASWGRASMQEGGQARRETKGPWSKV